MPAQSGTRLLGDYTIEEHRHKFAVWAAARAAQRGWAKAKVGILRDALEACGVVKFLEMGNPAIDAQTFKRHHREWCRSLVESLQRAGVEEVTFWRVAKLVAVYIKGAVVLGPNCCSGLAGVAHPPIDSILLRNLAANRQASSRPEWANLKWTKLAESEYYCLVEKLRECLGPEEPFWKLEKFWTITEGAESAGP